MAITINRAPFNALVDDSGQNLDGSIWNKAAIKTVLLDPIDATLASVNGNWFNEPFNAANFWPGVTAPNMVLNTYTVVNKTLFWILQISNAPPPSPLAGNLPCRLPGGNSLWSSSGVFTAVAYASDGGVAVPAIAAASAIGSPILNVSKIAGGNWTTAPVVVYLNVTIPIA